VSVEDPHAGLKLAEQTSFAVIFLDVQMPGMDGFELCTRIRALPTNKNAPGHFVMRLIISRHNTCAMIYFTSLTNFRSRASSTRSVGNDLIAKPFMFIELSVKALT